MEAIEAKIEKLLRMADGIANENESAVALQMAQKLADAHNLDLDVIGKSGARKDEQISKGLYQYQRTLYANLAELNHCKAWISKGTVKGSKYQTRLLGSKVNVTLTKMMADYVEEVANRMVRERYEPREFFSKSAHIFREGFIDRMVERIKDRRREEEEEAERERAKREQEARTRHPGAATENAIVLISDVAREEAKANYDYLNGEGAWDAWQARIAANEERRRQAIVAAEEWERNNPELAAAKKRQQQEEYDKWNREWEAKQRRLERAAERRRQERINQYGYDPQDYKNNKPTKYDSDHYWAGKDVAENVSLDDQIDHQQRKAVR